MKNKKRIIALIMAICVIFTCFTACSDKQDTQPEQTTQPQTEEPDTTVPEIQQNVADEAENQGNINRLTGLYDISDEAVGKRPVAVMINNIKAALPSYGISQADIMFEIVVEGGITRMMALYADYTRVPEVCSVRSCRYYYPIFALGYDAVYFCYGSNKLLGTPTLKRIGIDYFDGNSGYSVFFARDAERQKTYSSEHTAYLKGPDIPKGFEKYSVRSDYLEGKDVNAFNFCQQGESALGSKDCTKATLSFSNSYYSTFNYDSATETYTKLHSGSAHVDQRSSEQLRFTNVFVLVTEVNRYKNESIMEVNWKGGTGYYISKGKYQEITWEKPTEDSEITYYAADGSELRVNPGKSYIGVISAGKTTIS